MPAPRLGPKKAISILPSRRISITPGKEGKLLPEGSKFTVYGKKKPKLLPTKFAGKAKTGPTAAVNRYMERGGRKIISKVYSKNYNIVRSGSKVYAVKIGGEKMFIDGGINESAVGWLSESGQLTTAKDFRDSLIAIDGTTVGREWGENVLTSLWDDLTMAEKAQVVNEFADFDWAGFWAEMYPIAVRQGGEPMVDRQYELYDEIVMRIERALGRSL